MASTIRVILFLPLMTISLSACDKVREALVGQLHNTYTADNVVSIRGDNGKTAGDKLELFDIENDRTTDFSTYGDDTTKSSIWYLKEAIKKDNKDKQKLIRNSLIDEITILSNRKCDRFKTLLVGLNSSRNLLSGLTSAGLSGAASVVTGGTSNLLSLASSLVTGANAQVQSEFFDNQIPTIIDNEIDKNRKIALNSIQLGKRKEYSEYPILTALIDLDIYHRKCSIDTALASLQGSGESNASLQNEIYSTEARIAVLNQQIQALEDGKDKNSTAPDQITALKSEIEALRARAKELSLKIHGVAPETAAEPAITEDAADTSQGDTPT